MWPGTFQSVDDKQGVAKAADGLAPVAGGDQVTAVFWEKSSKFTRKSRRTALQQDSEHIRI